MSNAPDSRATVQSHLAAAAAALRAGRADEAASHRDAALAADPANPAALNMAGVAAMNGGDLVGAAGLFQRAIAADPRAPDLWMNLAKARRLAGDDAAERAALEGALAVDQRFFMALVRLAELHERRGERQDAQARWSGVLAMIGMMERRTPELEALADHAGRYVADSRRLLEAEVGGRLAPALAGVSGEARTRFDACLAHTLGARPIYANQCSGLHYPFLPACEFFDRSHFPWLPALEARTGEIRAELEAALAGGPVSEQAGFRPYVEMPSGTPANIWTALDRRMDWGALHLWRHGERIEEACARMPVTAAILDGLPLAQMPRRTPTAFFSVLQPRTHLPAHTGVSNTRAIVHLPLIVPAGADGRACRFRVGGETRTWREGEAWAFDDTIEHEAWNDSDEPRAILILDVWNPFIGEAEREMLGAFFEASDAVGGGDARTGVGD